MPEPGSDDGARFWRGPIASEAQAEGIIAWACWPFIVGALLGLPRGVAAITSGNVVGALASLVSTTVYAGIPILLLTTRRRGVAIALLLLSFLHVAFSISSFVVMIQLRQKAGTFTTSPGWLAVALPTARMLIALALVMQVRRAIQATGAGGVDARTS